MVSRKFLKAPRYNASKYIFHSQRNGIHALYNGLNGSFFFLDDEAYNWQNRFSKTLNQAKKIRSLNKGKKELLRRLIDHGVFVLADKDEKKEIEVFSQGLRLSPKLTTLYLVPTTKCNFDCGYCVIEKNLGPEQKKTMSKRTLLDGLNLFIRNCSKSARKIIVFYGGEPLISKELIAFAVRYIRQKEKAFGSGKVIILINTNAALLDEALLHFYNEHNCELIISIDGQEKDNDKARFYKNKKGTFADTMGKIELTQKTNVKMSFSFTIGKHNLEKLVENYLVIQRDYPNCPISFNFMVGFRNSNNPFMVSDKQMLKGLDIFYEFMCRQGFYEAKYYRRWKAFLSRKKYLAECTGYGEQLVVFPEGMITPCHFLTGFPQYSIKTKDVFDIKKETIWKEWAKRKPPFIKRCLKCKLIFFCGGGCAYKALINDNSIWEVDRFNCKYVSMILKKYLWQYFDLYLLPDSDLKFNK